MPTYKIITPNPSQAPYNLTGSMLVGGPPPIGEYTTTTATALLAWWRLDTDISSAGNASDYSGNSNTAVPSSSANRHDWPWPYVTPSSLVQANSNYFDGDTTSLYVESTDVLSFTDGSGTDSSFTAHFRFNGTFDEGGSSYYYLTYKGNNTTTTHEWGAYLWDGDGNGITRLYINLWDSTGDYVRAGTTEIFYSSVWYDVTVTYGGTNEASGIKVYVNGAETTVSTTDSGTYDGMQRSGQRLHIGAKKTFYDFKGYLADVALWNIELSLTEIKALYYAVAGPIYYTYRNFDLIGYGERLSPTGSQYEMTLQGLDAQKDDIYYPSLLPRIRQGAPMSLWRAGDKLSDKYFDDTLSLNPDPNDMRGENDVKISQRINFDWEQLDFGQAPTTQQGMPYVETQKFNPVAYIQSSEETMWPVNLFNLGSLLDHEFDGVIEPLDIRAEVLGISDNRYEGHAVRGGLTGGASETYFGSKQIVDVWKDTDAKVAHFLDAPINWGTIPIGAYSNITYEPDAPFRDVSSFDLTNGMLFLNNPTNMNGTLTTYTLTASDGLFAFSTPTQAHSFPSESPVLWWRLNTDIATAGGEIDASGNGHNATAFPAPDWPSPAFSPSSLIQDNSNYFDGTTSGLGTAIGLDALNFGDSGSDQPFTWHFRFYGDFDEGAGVHYYLCYKGDSDETSNIEYRMYLSDTVGDGICTFTARFDDTAGGGYTYRETAAIITNNQWHSLVVAYNGTRTGAGIKIYLDGLDVSGTSGTSGTYNSMRNEDANLYVGAKATSWDFKGYLADVTLWAVELAPNEVRALHAAAQGTYAPGPIEEDSLISAMRLLSTGSQPGIDPAEERANHGFYFDKNIGSIIYGDW